MLVWGTVYRRFGGVATFDAAAAASAVALLLARVLLRRTRRSR
jgi:hypothetical protein